MIRYCIMMLLTRVWLHGHDVFCLSLKFIAEEGPYEVVVYNTSNCLAEQPSWFQTNVTAYNSNGLSLLRGTVVSKRDVTDVKFRVRLFYIENNKEVLAFEAKNQKCRNGIIRMVLFVIGLPVDHKKCALKPGIYEFNNLNLNSVVHSVVPSLWYGTMKIRWEAAVRDTRFMCLDISLQSIKPKDVKKATT